MEVIYTHTTWRVIPGKEKDFEARWADWVGWSHEAGLVKGSRLLKSSDEPGVFISFGLWQTLSMARAWRSTTGYQERLARLQELVQSFEPRTLTLVAEG